MRSKADKEQRTLVGTNPYNVQRREVTGELNGESEEWGTSSVLEGAVRAAGRGEKPTQRATVLTCQASCIH